MNHVCLFSVLKFAFICQQKSTGCCKMTFDSFRAFVKTQWSAIDFYSIEKNTMEVSVAPHLLQTFFKISSLCSAEQRNLYRFGTTWGWVNDDRIAALTEWQFFFNFPPPFGLKHCVRSHPVWNIDYKYRGFSDFLLRHIYDPLRSLPTAYNALDLSL